MLLCLFYFETTKVSYDINPPAHHSHPPHPTITSISTISLIVSCGHNYHIVVICWQQQQPSLILLSGYCCHIIMIWESFMLTLNYLTQSSSFIWTWDWHDMIFNKHCIVRVIMCFIAVAIKLFLGQDNDFIKIN